MTRWYNNRQAITKLFQVYVDTFGSETGEQIIRTITHHLGRLRISVPCSSVPRGQRYHSESYLYLCELWKGLNTQFGDPGGTEVMRIFMRELGGLRLYFPDFEDLAREERNRKIRAMWTGSNRRELAAIFDLDETSISRIVRNEEIIRLISSGT